MDEPKRQKPVLVVTVDDELRSGLVESLTPQGYRVLPARSHAEALSVLNREPADVILLDIEKMPSQEIDLVHYSKSRWAHTEIIVLATIRELDEARNALRNGASFYLIKPVNNADIKKVLDKVSIRVEQQKERIELEQQFLTGLMAGNPLMEKVLKLAVKIAPTSSTVLIGGESGSGKEFFAKIIHRMSLRADDKFVAMNCGAVPDTLFESELFGHRKGAFTGADRDREGLVEEANLGTLFLDEVGELSPSAQVKLLRFLQERTFRRVGDNTTRSVDVRIIAATNKDLWDLVQAGKFREDLFYRLNVFYLNLPPLRKRKETIPSLIRLFVHRYNLLLDKQVNSLSKTAEVMLAKYDYPGNVRELENVIEHAMVLVEGPEITESHLPEFMYRNQLLLAGPDKDQCADGICTLEEVERKHIESALRLLDFNYTEAARRLGISRSTLWRKIKTYRIQTPKEEDVPAEESET